MKELINVDLWDLHDQGKTICITTNGFVKKDGKAVMGRGCAKEALNRYPNIDKILGYYIKCYGNKVHISSMIFFPVKHNWWEKADIELIKKSCKELNEFAEEQNIDVYLPRPGCGNGGLDWETEVKPDIEPLLGDKITIVTNESTRQ